MSSFGEIKAYARFARDLKPFLREPVTYEQAVSKVKERLASREESFLGVVEKNIFGNPKSPYLRLFEWAECSLEDVRTLVRDRGLEPALEALRAAGVYVAFEEFKCRTPIVRDGKELHVSPGDFDNPFLAAHYEAETSGSTGRATRVSIDLNVLGDQALLIPLVYAAWDLKGAPILFWREILPSPAGLGGVLCFAKAAVVAERWFTPVSRRELRRSFKSWLATEYVLLSGRRAGVPVPRPEVLEPENAVVVARWAEEKVASGGGCSIATSIGLSMRIASAARDAGIDLTGTVFWGGGEPSTPAKVQEIESSGGRYAPGYATSELGGVGLGCPNPNGANDNHFMKDRVAVLRHPRQVPGFELTVDAFLFTGLVRANAKVLLNVESDDYGVMEKRSCGCLFEELGFDEHVRDIFSFSKLTGEGVTLVGSDMIRILEEDLPSRFGGSPADYQLLEEEDQEGFTKVNLVVSPRVSISSEQEVVEFFLDALKRNERDMESALFRSSDTLRVRRMEPLQTGRGKVMPLHAKRRV